MTTARLGASPGVASVASECQDEDQGLDAEATAKVCSSSIWLSTFRNDGAIGLLSLVGALQFLEQRQKWQVSPSRPRPIIADAPHQHHC